MAKEEEDDEDNVANKNKTIFRSTFSIGILKLAKQIINEKMPANPRISGSKIRIHQRQVQNITTSLFHFSNLDHIKSVPFYRISTPKAPFYREKGGPDDRYIIPVENYKAITIDNYIHLMGFS
mmetsp:Transcript_46453/g.34121  ORF Transcript_46453/g.34121 Transcript_46453/m.34121 type:complete len:123 (-) Transcript_46453:317-685(-)